MSNKRNSIILFSIFTSAIILFSGGCKKEDPPALNTTYNLMVKDVLGVTGTVKFTETSSTIVTIDIVLANAPAGTHPAYLMNSPEVENGTVAVILNPVDATGKSTTIVPTMTYNQLIVYDGNIKVLLNNYEPNVILAQGDIGGNVLTITNKSYPLGLIGSFGVSGTALFEKRLNGNTLVSIVLTGTIQGAVYPATINLGSVASVGGGPVVKLLNSVDGTTGKSFTNIRKLDSGIDITYDNWLVYDGYLNIYQTAININNIICNGNIGSN